MKAKGIIFVILACFGWGTIGIFNANLTKMGYDSVTLASIRCIASAAVLWGYIFAKKLARSKMRVKLSLKEWMFVAGEGLSFYTMAVLYFIAIVMTSPSTASVLLTTAPVMVMVFSVIFWKERLNIKKILALCAALLGSVFISGIIGSGSSFEPLGVMIGILAAVAYAGYSIFTKLALKRNMPSEVNIAYSFLFSALGALIYAGPVNLFGQVMNSTPQGIILLICMGTVTGAFAGLMYTEGMKLLPAGMAATFACLEPLISTTMSVAFLGERLSVPMVIGIVLILTSATLLSLKSKEEKAEKENKDKK